VEAALSRTAGDQYRRLSLWWDGLADPIGVRAPLPGDLDVDVLIEVDRLPTRDGKVNGAVLQKGSKLTSVVDTEIAKLWKNGTIGKLQKKWFNLDFASIPVLK